jgi:hypothetical protein
MPSYGYGRGDVNNSISVASAYPGGRSMGLTQPSATRYRTRNNSSGEAASVNQQGQRILNGGTRVGGTPVNDPMPTSNGIMGKPSSWWITFALIFVGFIWLSRRYGGEERFSNVKISVYNGIFLTFWIILILNLLKVAATRFKIPGISELILAA